MQDLKILEDGFEQSILREEQVTAGTTGYLTSPVDDVNLVEIPLAEQRAKYEVLSCLSLLPHHPSYLCRWSWINYERDSLTRK
jgi:hypothetical protein